MPSDAMPSDAVPRDTVPRTRRFPLATFLIASCLLLAVSSATAQRIGDPLPSFLDAVAASGADDADGATVGELAVRPEEAGGLLTAVALEGPMHDAGVDDAARVLAVASGYGAGIEEPIASFLRDNLTDLAQQGSASVRVEAYRLEIDAEAGDPVRATLRLVLPRVEEEAFGAAVAAKGPNDALVVVREFSDFQCPFCKRFAEEVLDGGVLGALLASGEVRFAFHHLPLSSIHANAEPAAEAAQCVADRFGQDAFWAYHDLLFERQAAWSDLGDPNAYFARLARDVEPELLTGADGDAGGDADALTEGARSDVRACLASGAARAAVQDARRVGAALALSGTPTVFVGGYRMDDFRSPDAYARLIRLELAVRGEGE
ncbi:MAG: thioredoxin domain-containing protein [Trueperaceae bacterium]